MEAPERSLARDTRGAVLLIAVFMSAFLVGALWYIIGIGDAAIYRQYMQDGADAVAFGSAVYHARGMNVIALINMVMAAVLMVLVAFKIGQLLLAAANIASCLAGAFFNPICNLTTAAEAPYAAWVMKVEKIVDTILRALYVASNGVAIGMPWVAEAKAVIVGQQYKPSVDGGLMLSISLVPGPIELAAGGFGGGGSSAPGGGGGGVEPPKSGAKKPSAAGMRWGLPVQDDEFSVLCGKAGEYVVSFVFAPFSFIGMGGLAKGIEKFAGGLVSGIVKTFPGYSCGDLKDAASGLGDSIKKAILEKSESTIKELCEKRMKDIALENFKRKKEGLPPIPFDFKKCMEATEKSFSHLDKPGSTLGTGKTSKRVYDAASIGDDYFATWAFDWGDLSDQTGAGKGVDIAAWNKAKSEDANVFSKIGIAKAEFYYEPRPGGPTRWRGDFKGTVPLMKEPNLAAEAMWNMRWRARLRRLRLPTPQVGGILASKIGAKIKVPIIGAMLKWPVDKVGDMLDDKVAEMLGSVGGGTIVH